MIALLLNIITIGMEITEINPCKAPQKKQTIFEFFGIDNKMSESKTQDLKQTIAPHVLDGKQWWYVDKTFPHKDVVNSVCISPSETLLATGARDYAAHIFDINTEKKIASFPRDGCVNSVCFDPTEKYLATGSSDGEVRISDIKIKKAIASIPNNNKVYSLCFSPSGKLLAVAEGAHTNYIEDNYSVHIFDIENKKDIKEVACSPHSGLINSICFDPTEKYLAIASFSGTHILNLENEEKNTSFDFDGSANSLCFDFSGKFLAIGSLYRAQIFDIDTHKEIAYFPHHYIVYDAFFNDSGKCLATRASDGKIRIFDIATSKKVVTIAHSNNIFSMCVSPSKNILVTGSINEARMFAEHNKWTLEQLLLKRMLHLWLLTAKPDKNIDSINRLLADSASKFRLEKKHLHHIWQTLPDTMQSALWRTMHNKIKLYGKATDNCIIS